VARQPTRTIAIAATAIIGLVLLLQLLLGVFAIGVQNDEPRHEARTQTWIDTGWYLPPSFLTDDEAPDDEIEAGRVHAYGAGFSVYAHAASWLLGTEQLGETNRSAAAFKSRGLAVAVLGILAAMAVGTAMGVVSRQPFIGVWAATATMAMPLWLGYSKFAVKDVPVAAGWTLVTSALVVSLALPIRRAGPLVIGAASFIGVWFSFGVRTALWVPLLATLFVWLALVAFHPDRRRIRPNVVAAAVGLMAGALAVAGLHYRNAATPRSWLIDAVATSGDFHWTGTTLTAGQLMTEKPPWWYLPAWIGGSTPLLLGLLALTAMAVLAVSLARTTARPSGGPRRALGDERAAMLLWVQQATMLPLVSIVGGATMYAGLRQHLYVIPAIAALAAFGAHMLVSRFGARGIVALIVVIAVPTVEQATLYPYNFVYKNVVAAPVEDRWETDMHWVSGREALRRLPEDVDPWCHTGRRISGADARLRVVPCAEESRVNPYLDEQGADASRPWGPDGHVGVISRKYRGSPPPPGCEEFDSVTRRLRFETVTIGYVLACDLSEVD
jgi:hypothetical protein